MSKNRAVWEVYDEYRTIRQNIKYYSAKLKRVSRTNLWSEIILAVCSSSAITAWLFTNWGPTLWRLLGTLATIIAVARLVWKPYENIKKYEQRITAYRGIEFDLESLKRDIERASNYTDSYQSRFDDIVSKRNNFALTYVDPDTDTKLLKKCWEEVNKELPSESFFVPPGG